MADVQEMARIYKLCTEPGYFDMVSSHCSQLVSSAISCDICGRKEVNQPLTIHETFWGMGFSEPYYYCDPCFLRERLEGKL